MESTFSVKNELLKFLKQKTKYSYSDLKHNLLIESDDMMFLLFIEILDNFVNTYNIQTPVYYNKYILKILDYLRVDMEEITLSMKEEITTKLKSLEYSINRILINNYEYKKNNVDINKSVCISNKAFLLNMNSEIKHIRYNINGLNNEELEKLKYEVLDIIKLCIFELKDYNCVKDIVKSCGKGIVNDELVKKVLEYYKNNLLNSKNYNDIVYYHKVIMLLIKNLEDEYSYLKNVILAEMQHVKTLSKEEIYNEDKKQQVELFAGEILNYLNGINLSKNEALSNLKEKYQINDVNNLNIKDVKNWKQYKLDKTMIITIDSPKAKILENAISIEQTGNQYHLKYYVTDVPSYVQENPELEKHIIDKAFSIKGYPILPNKFANKRLSLQKGKYRKVVAFLFTLDEKLKVVNFKVERQMIKVKYNLTFSDVLPILEDNKSSKLKNMLSLLYNVSMVLNSGNQKPRDYHMMKEISKEILYDVKYAKNYGRTLVGDYQIFLNAFIANECYKKGYPYLYRNNEFSHNQDKLIEISEKYRDNPELKDIIHMISTIYTPSTYSTTNKGHEGLDKVAYGEVSKPCRSAASYINLKQIIEYYIDGLVLSEDDKNALLHKLEKDCIHFNQKRELYDDYLKEEVKIKKKK